MKRVQECVLKERVRKHFEDRGYTVRTDCKVRGRTGNVYVCHVVAQGGLGNLMIELPDEGGFEPEELVSILQKARDIGAAAVLAEPQPHPLVRQEAQRQGIIILDDRSLNESVEPIAKRVEETRVSASQVPWPDPDGRRAKPAKASIWGEEERDDWLDRVTTKPSARNHAQATPAIAERPNGRFTPEPTTAPPKRYERKVKTQLESEPTPYIPSKPAPRPVEVQAPRRVESEAPSRVFEVGTPVWINVLSAVLYAGVTAIVLFLLIVLFLA